VALLSDHVASRDDWLGRYEDLRRLVLEQAGHLPRRPGIAVFVRQGMAAWMQAWPEEANCPLPPSNNLESPRMPSELYEDVTQLLVDMLFHHQQEALV